MINGKNIKDMKNIYKILTVLLCALGILLPNACTKNYEELNKDPKIITPEVINVGLLLTNVEWNGVVGNGSLKRYIRVFLWYV